MSQLLLQVQYPIGNFKTISVGLNIDSFEPEVHIGRADIFGVTLNLQEWNSFVSQITQPEVTSYELGPNYQIVIRNVLGEKLVMIEKNDRKPKHCVYFNVQQWKQFKTLLLCIKHAVFRCAGASVILREYVQSVVSDVMKRVRQMCCACCGLTSTHTCTNEHIIRENICYPEIIDSYKDIDMRRIQLEVQCFCTENLVLQVRNHLYNNMWF